MIWAPDIIVPWVRQVLLGALAKVHNENYFYNYMIFILVYLSDICKSGDHVIIFHAQEMPTLPAAPYPCELKPINLQVFWTS